MKRILTATLITMLMSGMVCSMAEAKCLKKFGVFKNYGQQRSTVQKAINLLHPKGKARASAEHAVNRISRGQK